MPKFIHYLEFPVAVAKARACLTGSMFDTHQTSNTSVSESSGFSGDTINNPQLTKTRHQKTTFKKTHIHHIAK